MRIPKFRLIVDLQTHQGGTAAVELALVLGLLISIAAGIFGFGRAFWYYDALTKATRDGARLISISPKATIASQGVPAAQQLIVNAATSAGIPNFDTANVSVVCLDSSFNDSSCVDGTAPGGVRVQVVGFSIRIGDLIPFVVGRGAVYTSALSPHTTMRYML